MIYFMLDNALCVGYLPGFLGHWLVVFYILAAAVVLFVFIIKLDRLLKMDV
jgi:hypothetical protein